MGVSLADLQQMVGRPFASGAAEWAHWENWLLADCTGADPLPPGEPLAHPVAIFPLALRAAGVTIADLFQRFGVGGGGSVRLAGYSWEYHRPLLVGHAYRGSAVVRRAEPRGDIVEVEFALVLSDDDAAGDGPTATMAAIWELSGVSG